MEKLIEIAHQFREGMITHNEWRNMTILWLANNEFDEKAALELCDLLVDND